MKLIRNSVAVWSPIRLKPWTIAVAWDSDCLKTAAPEEKSSGVPKQQGIENALTAYEHYRISKKLISMRIGY